jgi:hypothetical protein
VVRRIKCALYSAATSAVSAYNVSGHSRRAIKVVSEAKDGFVKMDIPGFTVSC